VSQIPETFAAVIWLFSWQKHCTTMQRPLQRYHCLAHSSLHGYTGDIYRRQENLREEMWK
jgi:hypothetical protein